MTNPISPLRSEVIEKSIAIEMLISVIISQYYLKKPRIDFITDVLYDERCTFAFKINVLIKVCPSLLDMKEKIHRLSNIRNFFAHVGMEIIEGPDPDGPSRILNPHKPTKIVNFESMHNEFIGIEQTIHARLLETYQSMGGKLEQKTHIDTSSE